MPAEPIVGAFPLRWSLDLCAVFQRFSSWWLTCWKAKPVACLTVVASVGDEGSSWNVGRAVPLYPKFGLALSPLEVGNAGSPRQIINPVLAIYWTLQFGKASALLELLDVPRIRPKYLRDIDLLIRQVFSWLRSVSEATLS